MLLDKEKSNFIEDYSKYAYPFAELGLQYNTYISAKVFTVKEWESHLSLLRYNVEREGIEVS